MISLLILSKVNFNIKAEVIVKNKRSNCFFVNKCKVIKGNFYHNLDIKSPYYGQIWWKSEGETILKAQKNNQVALIFNRNPNFQEKYRY